MTLGLDPENEEVACLVVENGGVTPNAYYHPEEVEGNYGSFKEHQEGVRTEAWGQCGLIDALRQSQGCKRPDITLTLMSVRPRGETLRLSLDPYGRHRR